MLTEVQCAKIIDGLYLGNRLIASDFQFLVCNKFQFVINCTPDLPNYFEFHGFQYLRFKLSAPKTKTIYDRSLKKVAKMDHFIRAAEDQGVCCLIHSNSGNNRSVVMLAGHLMSRFQWRRDKCLSFIASKGVDVNLSEPYLQELTELESILSERCPMTSSWDTNFLNEDDEIVSKTYLNALPTKQVDQKWKKKVPINRVVWRDKLNEKRDGSVKNWESRDSRDNRDSRRRVPDEETQMEESTHRKQNNFIKPPKKAETLLEIEVAKSINNALKKRQSQQGSLRRVKHSQHELGRRPDVLIQDSRQSSEKGVTHMNNSYRRANTELERNTNSMANLDQVENNDIPFIKVKYDEGPPAMMVKDRITQIKDITPRNQRRESPMHSSREKKQYMDGLEQRQNKIVHNNYVHSAPSLPPNKTQLNGVAFIHHPPRPPRPHKEQVQEFHRRDSDRRSFKADKSSDRMLERPSEHIRPLSKSRQNSKSSKAY